MKHEMLLLLAAVAGATPFAASVFAAKPPVALPPVIVTGRVVDYEGSGLTYAEVRVRKDAVLPARSSVCHFDDTTSANYAVSVPLANSDIPEAACAGDKLVVEVDDGTATYSNTNAEIAVTAPGEVIRLDLLAASCTNPYGVSDRYLDDIREWVEAFGIEGFLDADGNYQPNADYDGDGVSNYGEYLAGSDPFDESDAGLRILSWRALPGDDSLMEATFLAGRNRAYAAEKAGHAADGGFGPFALVPHLGSPAATERRNYFISGDPEIHAIYLYRDGASGFYRLRLE